MSLVGGVGLVLMVALIACSEPPPPAPQLDSAAQSACETFAPLGGQVRTGELEGPELYRKLQDVWNFAKDSRNADVRDAAQKVLSAAIQNDQQATNAAVTELQEACSLPFT